MPHIHLDVLGSRAGDWKVRMGGVFARVGVLWESWVDSAAGRATGGSRVGGALAGSRHRPPGPGRRWKPVPTDKIRPAEPRQLRQVSTSTYIHPNPETDSHLLFVTSQWNPIIDWHTGPRILSKQDTSGAIHPLTQNIATCPSNALTNTSLLPTLDPRSFIFTRGSSHGQLNISVATSAR